jgi:hypothetical protein
LYYLSSLIQARSQVLASPQWEEGEAEVADKHFPSDF